MNIADKGAFTARRSASPRGRAFRAVELTLGDGGDRSIRRRGPTTGREGFLTTEEETLASLGAAGFAVVAAVDKSRPPSPSFSACVSVLRAKDHPSSACMSSWARARWKRPLRPQCREGRTRPVEILCVSRAVEGLGQNGARLEPALCACRSGVRSERVQQEAAMEALRRPRIVREELSELLDLVGGASIGRRRRSTGRLPNRAAWSTTLIAEIAAGRRQQRAGADRRADLLDRPASRGRAAQISASAVFVAPGWMNTPSTARLPSAERWTKCGSRSKRCPKADARSGDGNGTAPARSACR
jgi:hypothetical protein